jgi:hypothetical protein
MQAMSPRRNFVQVLTTAASAPALGLLGYAQVDLHGTGVDNLLIPPADPLSFVRAIEECSPLVQREAHGCLTSTASSVATDGIEPTNLLCSGSVGYVGCSCRSSSNRKPANGSSTIASLTQRQVRHQYQ